MDRIAALICFRVLQLDEKQWQRVVKSDFNYLVSMWAPDADKESLRSLMDFNNWAFFFDDRMLQIFDSSCLVMQSSEP